MTTKNSLFARAMKAGVLAIGLLSALQLTPSPLHAQVGFANSQAWQPWGADIRWKVIVHGRNNLDQSKCDVSSVPDCGLDTTDSTQSNLTYLNTWKAVGQSGGQDIYLVSGPFTQSNTGYKEYSPAKGWYGQSMSLTLTGYAPRISWEQPSTALIYDAQPYSTVGTTTSGYTIGATLSSTPGVNLGYGVQDSIPDVNITTTQQASSVTWIATLPSIGWHTPSVRSFFPDPIYPAAASKNGTTFTPSAIFEVPHNTGLFVAISTGVEWDFWNFNMDNSQIYGSSSGGYWADFTSRQIKGVGCLAPQGGNLASGTPVVEQSCQNSLSFQKWSYTADSQLKVDSPDPRVNACLDINGDVAKGDLKIGATVVVRTCDASRATQKWQVATTTYAQNITAIRSLAASNPTLLVGGDSPSASQGSLPSGQPVKIAKSLGSPDTFFTVQ